MLIIVPAAATYIKAHIIDPVKAVIFGGSMPRLLLVERPQQGQQELHQAYSAGLLVYRRSAWLAAPAHHSPQPSDSVADLDWFPNFAVTLTSPAQVTSFSHNILCSTPAYDVSTVSCTRRPSSFPAASRAMISTGVHELVIVFG